MRKRFIGMAAVVAAVSSIVIGVSPASAAAGWTASPGGLADGDAGVTVLSVRPALGGPDQILTCDSSHAELDIFPVSSTDHVADIDGITFSDCLLAGLITFDVEADTPWTLHASGISGDEVAGQIRGISATIVGSGCLATVGGFVDGVYDNGDAELRVTPNFTLEILSVDPIDDCLGLIAEGDTASFDGDFAVTPGQVLAPL